MAPSSSTSIDWFVAASANAEMAGWFRSNSDATPPAMPAIGVLSTASMSCDVGLPNWSSVLTS